MKNTIYGYFEKQVKTNLNHLAIFDENRSLTRLEFDRLIDTIAAKIPKQAKIVGVVMEHTVEMIASIFAILKTGRAYIPVKPDFPTKRINFMMKDANVDCVLTNKNNITKIYLEASNMGKKLYYELGFEPMNGYMHLKSTVLV